jgi:hypothetical protein
VWPAPGINSTGAGFGRALCGVIGSVPSKDGLPEQSITEFAVIRLGDADWKEIV